MRNFLSNIVATFTGPRYFPELQWSNLYTQNVFRAWEYLVGRKLGIRAESALANGVFYAFSWEASFAHTEYLLRQGVKKLLESRPRLVWIPVPTLQPAFIGASNPVEQIYRLAIAYDNGSWQQITAGSNPYTFTYTASGSNIAMLFLTSSGTTASTTTYNSVAMTSKNSWSSASYDQTQGYTLLNASSGANTFATTNSVAQPYGLVTTYSGVDNTLGINVTSINGTTGSGRNSNPTTSFTTTAGGCWGVGIVFDPDSFSGVTNSLTTTRVVPSFGGASFYSGDSNGSLGAAGSYTVGFSTGNTFIPGVWGVALLQVQASAVNSGFFFAASR